MVDFYSRPRMEATPGRCSQQAAASISTHAPAWGRLIVRSNAGSLVVISTHAPTRGRQQISTKFTFRFVEICRKLLRIFPHGLDPVFIGIAQTVEADRVLRLKLVLIEHGNDQPVAQGCPQFLHQVQGEGGPPRTEGMQVSGGSAPQSGKNRRMPPPSMPRMESISVQASSLWASSVRGAGYRR